MSHIVFEDLGIPKTHQKITPGNTATGTGAEFYYYTERTVAFTSGGTTEIKVGDWIVGATSSAKACVVSIVLTSGTWAGGNAAGTFRVKNQHGTFQSENVKVAAGTDDATIGANTNVDQGGYEFKGMQAKAALVSVYANTALTAYDGSKPDQTTLTGQPMVANSSILLRNINQIIAFKTIDYTASSASVANITYYF